MKKISVAIVSECTIHYHGFKKILYDERDSIYVNNESFSFQDVLKKNLRDTDIIIISMHDLCFAGIEQLHEVVSHNPEVRIIISCVDGKDKKAISLLAYGIKGILYNTDPPHIIVKAIKKVHEGELWIKRDIMAGFIDSSFSYAPEIFTVNEHTLTKREREVLYMVAKGFSNGDIADKIGVSVTTVKTHIYRIFKKTNIKNRAEAASYLKGI